MRDRERAHYINGQRVYDAQHLAREFGIDGAGDFVVKAARRAPSPARALTIYCSSGRL